MVSSSNLGLDEQIKTLNAAGSVIFGQGQKPNQVHCLILQVEKVWCVDMA